MLPASKFYERLQVMKKDREDSGGCREEKRNSGGGAGGMLIGLKVEKGMPKIDV